MPFEQELSILDLLCKNSGQFCTNRCDESFWIISIYYRIGSVPVPVQFANHYFNSESATACSGNSLSSVGLQVVQSDEAVCISLLVYLCLCLSSWFYLCLCQRHGLAVPRAGDRSYVTGSIRGWSRSHLTYLTGGC